MLKNPMKILVWGDLQAHPWQEHERPGRMEDVLASIRWVYDQARLLNVDMIVFLGDLFESKRVVRSDVFTKTIYTLNDLNADAVARGVDIRAIAGNHDLYNGQCTLDSVENWKVYNKSVGVVRKRQVSLGFVPYNATLPASVTDEYETFYKEPRIYFTHADLKGIRMPSGFTSKDTGLPDWLFHMEGHRGASAILNGHYHHPKTVNPLSGGLPVYIVGSPMEYSWSDLDSSVCRGCSYVEVNGHGFTLRRLENEAAPRFVSDKKNAREQDFIRPAPSVTVHCPDTVVHENVKVASDEPEVFMAEWLAHMKIPEAERDAYLETGRYIFGVDKKSNLC